LLTGAALKSLRAAHVRHESERVAAALGVSTATVGRDLGEFSHREKIKPAKTASNPKGAGRPKNSRPISSTASASE
jgi:hypothetical protein